MAKVINFPDQHKDFVIEDGANPIIDEDVLAQEISRLSGISSEVVMRVLEIQTECLINAGLIKE